MDKHQEELRDARRRAAFSVVLNTCLAVGKGFAGVTSNSTALISDAINSVTDVFASSAAYIGLWAAGRKHPSFPYGLYKAETIATMIVSGGILLAAYEIGRKSLFGSPSDPDVTIAIPVASVSFVIALVFGLVQLRAGKRLNSPALIADGRDYIADSLCTGVVLLGLMASWFGYSVDRWAAAIVAIFIFRSGCLLLKMALKDLLDASIDRDTEREIIKFIESHPRVTKVKQFLSRTAGGRFLVDVDIYMSTPSHRVADQVADRLEEEIPEQFPRVVMARIRPHFGKADIIRRLTPVTGPEGAPADHVGKAPWFLLEEIDVEKDVVLERKFIENPHINTPRQKGFMMGKWLLSFKPDEIIVPDGKEGAAIALLKTAGVEIK